MRKHSKFAITVASFLIFSLFLLSFIPHITSAIGHDHLHPKCLGNHLYELNQRIAAYHDSPVDQKQLAIVGSSYVSTLGDIAPIHNLGLHSARPSEYSALASHCQESDIVYCAVTIRDVAAIQGQAITKDVCRFHVKYAPIRNLWIFRELVRPALGMSHPKLPPLGITSKDIKLVKKLLDDDVPNRAARAIVRACFWFPMDPENISLAVFEKAHRKHPHMVFVLFPIAPLKRPEGNCLLKRRLTAFIDTDSALGEAFSKSDTPFITVSIEPSHFRDTWHYTPAGAESIRQQLIEAPALTF